MEKNSNERRALGGRSWKGPERGASPSMSHPFPPASGKGNHALC